MAKVDTQSIPAELREAYENALGVARLWKTKPDVRKRYPFRLPHMQGNGRIFKDPHMGGGVTNAQFENRRFFRKSCDCYNLQNPSHDIIDPPTGPKSRGYWFDQAIGSGLWYYDYFIHETMDGYIASGAPVWCRKDVVADSWVEEQTPDANYGTLDFLRSQKWLGHQTEIYVTKNDPLTRIYHFYIESMAIYPYDPKVRINFRVYEIAAPINELGITWNNKPALGNLVATFSKGADDEDTWAEIELPNVKAFAIITPERVPPSIWTWGIDIASREALPDPDIWPYWT